jgi:hypothetical protein
MTPLLLRVMNGPHLYPLHDWGVGGGGAGRRIRTEHRCPEFYTYWILIQFRPLLFKKLAHTFCYINENHALFRIRGSGSRLCLQIESKIV